MKVEYIGIAIVAFLWGGYPLITRAAGGGGILGTFVMMTAGWVTIAIATALQGFGSQLTSGQTLRLAGAGSMMGIGLIAFNWVASSERIAASVSIPIMDTAMMLVTVLAAVWFFGEPLTLRRGIGLALLVAGIATLHQS